MRTIEFAYRMATDVSPEAEWLYLVNETYIGEMCIVPLLEELYALDNAGPAFRRMVARQIDEEQEHVERYRELLRFRPLKGSGYNVPFAAYVRNLPNTTLKMFALQALLEGISLGALRYRTTALSVNPHRDLDARIMDDEERHTKFSYGFFKALIGVDGVIDLATFDRIAREVNAIFARHFNGAAIAEFFRAELGFPCDAQRIDTSDGMKKFFWKSATSIVENKRQFVNRYHGTCKALSAA